MAHAGSFKSHNIAFLNDPKCDLILQILIELNVLQHLARLPVHEGSFKNLKNGFLNDPKSQKIIYDVIIVIFQLCQDFDGNLAQQLLLLIVYNENSAFP